MRQLEYHTERSLLDVTVCLIWNQLHESIKDLLWFDGSLEDYNCTSTECRRDDVFYSPTRKLVSPRLPQQILDCSTRFWITAENKLCDTSVTTTKDPLTSGRGNQKCLNVNSETDSFLRHCVVASPMGSTVNLKLYKLYVIHGDQWKETYSSKKHMTCFSDLVANEMSSVFLYQLTWALTCPCWQTWSNLKWYYKLKITQSTSLRHLFVRARGFRVRAHLNSTESVRWLKTQFPLISPGLFFFSTSTTCCQNRSHYKTETKNIWSVL